MARPFSSYDAGAVGPAIRAFAITPADGSDLTDDIRAVTLNGGGTLSYVGWDGATYTTAALPAGTYPVQARRIRATGTTATGITGWV